MGHTTSFHTDPQVSPCDAEQPPAAPQRRPVPMGRVLTVACFVPILAMIVLGASRIDAIRDVEVGLPTIDVSVPGGDDTLYSPGASQNTFTLETAAADLAAGETVIQTSAGLMRVVATYMMEATAYCPCTICCGKHAKGITASGKPVSYNAGRFVAADARLFDFGTRLRIHGYHDETVVEVIDRGGAIKGYKLDVYFPTHQEAREWGRQLLPVDVLEPVEPESTGELQ